jgi:hypothetical protein
MRDDALKKDKRWRDWQAATRTWLTHAREFEDRDRSGKAGQAFVQQRAKPGEHDWREDLAPEVRDMFR